MSDSEEDYMTMEIPDTKQDVKPSLLPASQKRKLELYKKQLEMRTKKPKTAIELERESLEKGLTTAISEENKGFKMLQKMGFKPGESLGKTQSGIKDPIKVNLKQGTSGLGLESRVKEVLSKKTELKMKVAKQTEEQFRAATRDKTMHRLLQQDFSKAQKACEDLDFRNDVKDPIEEYFWTNHTIIKRRQKDDPDCETIEEDYYKEIEQLVNEDNLLNLIQYLRNKYFYCIYCGFVCTDPDDLEEQCPGPSRGDHDD